MAKKMLIDASQPEETRVAVVQANKVEDFEFESSLRKQLKGNIYLAKVTRVEPSLQAAFVEYGGNRHGFLPLSEIHPDYYQIPQADRQALLDAEAAEEAAANKEDDDDENGTEGNDEKKADKPKRKRAPRRRGGRGRNNKKDAAATDDKTAEDKADDKAEDKAADGSAEAADGADKPAGDNKAEAKTDADTKPAEEIVPVPDASLPTPDESAAAPAPKESDEKSDATEDATAKDAKDDGDDKTQAAATAEDDRLTADETEASDAEAETAAESAAEANVDSDAESDTPEANSDEPADTEEKPEANAEDQSDDKSEDGDAEEEESIEDAGSGDSVEEDIAPRRVKLRNYNIQEVIKRRQIVLVQVVKEERGNKGAALTTYLSLAGRYCVLMPNTARGGGISRKITNANDRKRLKSVARDMEVPKGMGLIVRTAGAQRTKAEIKRDYEYLLRLWENIRTHTLDSVAPALIYEEGNLIQRAIRDLYGKEVDQVQVQGSAGYKQAKGFMKMLMPSHAKNVVHYEDRVPLFTRHQVESQLEQMFEPEVQLKSGGYLVINPTEALVSIDVNSGKATKEKNVEATALATNLEAAEEVARQLRLRDLAGLIVIDFIDMDEHRNRRAIERKMKDALKSDRARIQVGRISHFGLLEMSRQRLGSSLLETHAQTCDTCKGTGVTRTIDAAALRAMRAVEEEAVRGRASQITLSLNPDVAVYVLNNKRSWLENAESVYGIAIMFRSDSTLGLSDITIDFVKGKPNTAFVPDEPESGAISMAQPESGDLGPTGIEVTDVEDEAEQPDTAKAEGDGDTDSEESPKPKKKRRRRRRRRKDSDENAENGDSNGNSDQAAADGQDSVDTSDDKSDDKAAGADADDKADEKIEGQSTQQSAEQSAEKSETNSDDDTAIADSPAAENTDTAEPKIIGEFAPEGAAEAEPEPEEPKVLAAPDSSRPKKRGWWQRK